MTDLRKHQRENPSKSRKLTWSIYACLPACLADDACTNSWREQKKKNWILHKVDFIKLYCNEQRKQRKILLMSYQMDLFEIYTTFTMIDGFSFSLNFFLFLFCYTEILISNPNRIKSFFVLSDMRVSKLKQANLDIFVRFVQFQWFKSSDLKFFNAFKRTKSKVWELKIALNTPPQLSLKEN